jgi:hypothetical protein
MPYDIKSNVADCQGFAVVKRGTSKVVGCHKTAGDAQKQVAALYAAEPDMFAKSLDDKGLVKMHNELHGRDLDSTTVTLHHIIVSEMRQRGVSHPNVDCDLHKAVVLKSELVLPIEKAQAILKGDKPGHAFRGNQWTKGGAGGSASGLTEQESKDLAAAKATRERETQEVKQSFAEGKEESLVSQEELDADLKVINSDKPMTEKQLIDGILRSETRRYAAADKEMELIREQMGLQDKLKYKKYQAQRPAMEARIAEIQARRPALSSAKFAVGVPMANLWIAGAISQGMKADRIRDISTAANGLNPQGMRNAIASVTNFGRGV